MGGLSMPRHTLMVGFPGFTGMCCACGAGRRLLARAAEGELSRRSQVIVAVQAINRAIATYWQVAAAQT